MIAILIIIIIVTVLLSPLIVRAANVYWKWAQEMLKDEDTPVLCIKDLCIKPASDGSNYCSDHYEEVNEKKEK